MKEYDFFGSNTRLHHVGLVVPSIAAIDRELTSYDDPIQKVRVAFVSLNGAPVELIEPLDESSPVTASLKKAQKLVHFCYEVTDIEQAVAYARQHGFVQIAKPVPAVAFDQRRIAWLFHRTFGLFELVEGELKS